MDHSAEFRRCLEELDVAAMRRLWRHVSPHLPQLKSDAECLVALHHARTQAESIPLRLRAWSHRWLQGGGYPSGLPDRLKPSAEQICPRVVQAVGISYNSVRWGREFAGSVERAMSDAVADAFAHGKTEPSFVTARMNEARDTTYRKLLGVVRS